MENIKAKFHEWFNVPYGLQTHIIGEGPTIVMLHGIATSSKSWRFLVPVVSQGYKCITIDLIGFGDSKKPGWYSYTPEEHIKNIHHTIKKLNVKEPYILMGHSMGALLALNYASRHPGKIERLILLSPPIYESSLEVKRAKKLWRDALYSKAYKYLRTHKKFTLKGAAGLKYLALRNNPFLITEETWNSFSKSLENSIEKQNVAKNIEQIFCPIDILYGTLDQLLIKKNILSLTRYPNVKLHPVRNGHIVNLRYALAVNNLLQKTKLE
jgi:pimeloyl-ACP methyl ester carboxylesterase